MARAEKLFASQGHHRDSNKRENIRGIEAEEEEGVWGRKNSEEKMEVRVEKKAWNC